jgi:fatty-acyl-CoA synthase
LPYSKIAVLERQEHGKAQGMAAAPLLIGDIFANAARAVPDRVAAALDGDALTFGELDAGADRVAAHLAARGVGIGTRVGLWCRTELGACTVFAALAKLGALLVPVSGLLGEEEVAPLFAAARPELVVLGAGRTPPETPSPTVTIDELLGATGGIAGSTVAAVAPDRALAETDPHVAFFTSGSTGAPKGAVLSHRANVLRSHPGALLEPRGAMVCPYPLFHMGAWTIALQQWQARDTVVLLSSTSAGAICDAVERHGATRLNCIPALWHRILDHVAGGTGPGQLRSLRFADTGTSATPVELLTAIAAAAPDAQVRVFYGSTEAGSVACLGHADLTRKPGSCGPPAPGVTVRCSDEGELQVRSTALFDGYLDDPEATAAAFDDGWYRTGDLAVEDADGYLTIVGRAGDVIRTGGEAVVPAEVEAVLADAPGVGEVAVVGLPDPTWGEVVCAVVVAGRGTPTLEALRAHCADRLAGFKRPRALRVVDHLPRTASTGQVQRRLLVEQLTAG